MYPRLARPPPGRRSPVVACRRRFQTRGSNGELASQPGSQVDGEEGGWRGATIPARCQTAARPLGAAALGAPQ